MKINRSLWCLVIFWLMAGFNSFALPPQNTNSFLPLESVNNLKQRTHQYQVTLTKSLKEAKVRICFDGKPPKYLAVDYNKANSKIISFPQSNHGFIEYHGRFWNTENLADNACIEYQSNIESYLSHDKSKRNKDYLISFQNENLWLWLPEKISLNESVEVTFNLPEQYNISTPWQLIEPRKKRYRIGQSSANSGFTLMIGEFELRKNILSNGLHLNIAMLSSLRQKEQLEQWVVKSAESVINYVGELKLSHLQVILIENSQFKKGVVPWGDFKRGGGFGVRFVVNSHKNIDNFYQDWTATHEFSHLLMPSLKEPDLWLSEGLSSYLQYILMAQSKNITEQQAWQKIYDGFSRGAKGTNLFDLETLLEASNNNQEEGSYPRIMRLYWSGAAYFFKADWLLRKNSNGKQSLADILLKLNNCCMNSSMEWTGLQLSTKLDALSQTKYFSQLYVEIAKSKKFPETAFIFKDLGIDIKQDKVVLTSNKNALFRQEISTRHFEKNN